jgi:hypothetical protein
MRQKRRAAAQVFDHAHHGLREGITPKKRGIFEVFVAAVQAAQALGNQAEQAVLDQGWVARES